MASIIPERIEWAVATLAVAGADSLMEIGCGRGVAITLIAPKLTSGRVLAIDRSATAIAAARKRCASWEKTGKVGFRCVELGELASDAGRFDKIFAINVNLFWTNPRAELTLVRKLLKPTGKLCLFYEPPASGQRDKIAGLISEKFSGSGLAVRKVVKQDGHAPLLYVMCGPDDPV